MENLEDVVDSEGSDLNVTEDATLSLNQPNLAKQEALQNQQPFNVISKKTPKSSQASRDSKVEQKMHEEAQTNLQKEEFNEQIFICDTLKLINRVVLEAEMCLSQVENFSGSSTDDKDYIYLEEMLIRATVALDNTDTGRNALVRQERKRAIQYIQKLMRILDARLKENKRNIRRYRKRANSEDSDDDV